MIICCWDRNQTHTQKHCQWLDAWSGASCLKGQRQKDGRWSVGAADPPPPPGTASLTPFLPAPAHLVK